MSMSKETMFRQMTKEQLVQNCVNVTASYNALRDEYNYIASEMRALQEQLRNLPRNG